MLHSLKNANKVIGVKQSRKAIKDDRVSHAFIAADAQSHITAPILEMCEEKQIPYTMMETMAQLGEACSIDVGAAVVVILKD